jgi:hypothetical protein
VPSKAMRYDFFMLRSQNADQTNVTPNFRIIFPSSVERAGMAGRYTGKKDFHGCFSLYRTHTAEIAA